MAPRFSLPQTLAQTLPQTVARALQLRRAVQLVWQSSPGWTLLNGGLLLIQGTLPLVGLYVMKRIVDGVTQALGTGEPLLALREVMGWLALGAGIAIVTTLSEALAQLVREMQSQAVQDEVAQVLHSQSIAVDLEYYENPNYYDSLHRAQREASYRPTRVLQNLLQLGQALVTTIAIVGLLLTLNWLLALLLFVTALPAAWVQMRHASRRYRWQRRRTEQERQSSYLSWLLTVQTFAKEIRLFNLGPLFSQRFDRLRQELRQERLQLSQRQFVGQAIAQVGYTIVSFLALGWIIYQTLRQEITLGDLVMYQQAFQRVQSALERMLGSLTNLYEDTLFLTNLYEFLDLAPIVTAPAYPKAVPVPMRQGLRCEGVGFQYPGSERVDTNTSTRNASTEDTGAGDTGDTGTGEHWALHQVDLEVKPGEVVALVGHNGSGKTSLIKLLCRLYDPTVGRITLDGIDIRDFDPLDFRQQFSILFQDYARYDLTAQDNIWFGDVQMPPEMPLIQAAAQRSGADAVIQDLPQGYETRLGHLFKGAEELSVGQWQKVAMARAFWRRSQLIVMDEPTSALDPEAEAAVFDQFRQLLQGKAAILISHRLSSVKQADRIYVLEKGRIVEAGTHAELMAQQTLYAQLFNLQAQHYL